MASPPRPGGGGEREPSSVSFGQPTQGVGFAGGGAAAEPGARAAADVDPRALLERLQAEAAYGGPGAGGGSGPGFVCGVGAGGAQHYYDDNLHEAYREASKAFRRAHDAVLKGEAERQRAKDLGALAEEQMRQLKLADGREAEWRTELLRLMSEAETHSKAVGLAHSAIRKERRARLNAEARALNHRVEAAWLREALIEKERLADELHEEVVRAQEHAEEMERESTMWREQVLELEDLLRESQRQLQKHQQRQRGAQKRFSLAELEDDAGASAPSAPPPPPAPPSAPPAAPSGGAPSAAALALALAPAPAPAEPMVPPRTEGAGVAGLASAEPVIEDWYGELDSARELLASAKALGRRRS